MKKNPKLWYIPLWKMLGEYTWLFLESLRLDGLLVCEVGLFKLLSRHAITLRRLDLYNMGLWQGSFRGLLCSLQSVLSLTRFRLRGATYAHHSLFDAWRLPFVFDFDAECWSPELKAQQFEKECSLIEAHERHGSISFLDVAQYLESFTSGTNWNWNLGRKNAINFMINPPAFRGRTHTENCLGCMLTETEIDQAWDEGLAECLRHWQDFHSPELPGVGEDAMVDFYLDNGFDEDGFNEEGYNAEGRHHLEIPSEWQGAKYPISYYSAKRSVRDGIRSRIVRYSQQENSTLG